MPKVQGFVENIVSNWSDNEFRRHFRINRNVFEHLLTAIRENLTKLYHGGFLPVPPNKQLLIFIWYLSNQDSQREIALLFGVSEWFVHCCIRHVAEILIASKNNYIIWPSHDRQLEIADNFEDIFIFPGIVGALDGTHIPIVNSPG